MQNIKKANLQANNNWNIKFITSEPGLEVTPESLSLYYKFAKFNFDCGDYAQANDMIDNYMSLFTNPPKPAVENDGEGEEDEGMWITRRIVPLPTTVQRNWVIPICTI